MEKVLLKSENVNVYIGNGLYEIRKYFGDVVDRECFWWLDGRDG